MVLFRSFTLLTVTLALPLAAACAQDTITTPAPRSPDVGARVLVTLSRAEGYEPSTFARMPVLTPRFTGRVVQVTSDSLWVQLHPSMSAVAVPQAVVRHVYVSRGRPRGPSIAWGALNGTLVGGIIGLGAAYPWVHGAGGRDRPEVLALYMVSGAISGMIGGAMHPSERWREVR